MRESIQATRRGQWRSGTSGWTRAEWGCASPSGWTTRAAPTGPSAAVHAPGASLWRSPERTPPPASGVSTRVRTRTAATLLNKGLGFRGRHTHEAGPHKRSRLGLVKVFLLHDLYGAAFSMRHPRVHAGDKILELVAWLEKGEISTEEDPLEALAAAPLPRKGTSTAAKSALASGRHRSDSAACDYLFQSACTGFLHEHFSSPCRRLSSFSGRRSSLCFFNMQAFLLAYLSLLNHAASLSQPLRGLQARQHWWLSMQ